MVDVIVQKALEYIVFDLPYSKVSLLSYKETSLLIHPWFSLVI